MLLAPLSGEKKGSSKKSQVLQHSGKWQCRGDAKCSSQPYGMQSPARAAQRAMKLPMPRRKTKTGNGNGAVHQKHKQHNQPGGGVQQWRCSSWQLLITLLLPRGIATTAAPPPTPQNDCCIFFLSTRHRCAATTETPPPASQVDCFYCFSFFDAASKAICGVSQGRQCPLHSIFSPRQKSEQSASRLTPWH